MYVTYNKIEIGELGEMAMTLYEALCGRKSVRKYNMNPISDEKLELVIRFAKSLPMLFPDIEVEFKILDCTSEEQRKKCFGRKFPFSVKAPYYLILTSTDHNGCYINAGYLMEQISLYLTSKEVGSCFLGSVKLSDKVKIAPGMEHVITLAFGKSNSSIYRTSGKVRRLPEEDTVVYKEDVTESVRTIVNAARIAPSSNNSQPWKFVVYNNRIHIFCKKNLINIKQVSKLKLINIGIAISNMLVVIDEMWLYPEFVHSDNISKQDFKNYDYITTLKIISHF